MRLDKYLADRRLGSRRDVKELIKKGRVTVDDMTAKDPGMSVSQQNRICLDGKPVEGETYFYYMLNKPPGYVSAREDAKEKTVLELLPPAFRKNVSPVGRLDKDTVGLLLLTNDGEMSHNLLSPKSHVDKVYLAGLDRGTDGEDEKAFAEGIVLADETKLLSATIKAVSEEKAMELMGTESRRRMEKGSEEATNDKPGDDTRGIKAFALVTIREGKYHQVKRMMAARGKKVLYLKRLSMGSLHLDPDLPEGSYRELTEGEIKALKGKTNVE
ncbi:MAG: rRNA pseudouridine synthase [Lachnospiraceae bacterium]|nr:rRNA pseudouridine synthase [Lachnospiraceae bacterium]